MKKLIKEIWVFIYVHLYAAPIALVSFGFIAIMMGIFWIALNIV